MKKILQVLKRDLYLELIGIALGILSAVIINIKTNNIIISVISGIIISAILVYVINRCCLYYIATVVEKTVRKERYIEPRQIKGNDPKIDAIIELDEKLNEFLDKYASGKT